MMLKPMLFGFVSLQLLCCCCFISKKPVSSFSVAPQPNIGGGNSIVSSSSVPESEILQNILNSPSSDNNDDKEEDIKLVSLADIRSFRAWDFSWPTLTKSRRFTKRNIYHSDAPLFSALEAHNKGTTASLLRHIGVIGTVPNSNSIVLHGGALVDLVLKRVGLIKDWDLHLIGPEFIGNETKCVVAANSFVEAVLDWIRQENEAILIRNIKHKQRGRSKEALYDMSSVLVSRSKSTITIKVPPRGYQIQDTILQLTFAPYSSISDLFRHSDPHCSRIAIQGNKVVLDDAARYCLESLCVVLDTKGLSMAPFCCQDEELDEDDVAGAFLSTYMHRAIKYFDEKGFDIILPELDMNMVPKRNLKFHAQEVLDLPALTVVYDQIENNKIMVSPGGLRKPEKTSGESSTTSDDDLWTAFRKLVLREPNFRGYDATGSQMTTGTSIHHNIRCLIADVYDQFQFVVEGESILPVFDFCPTLTPRMVDKTYETVKENLNSGYISLDDVAQYFSATSPDKVIERLVTEPLRNASTKAKLPARFQMDESVLDEIIATEKKAILSKLETLREKMIQEGLDKLVMDVSVNASTPEETIDKALYGDYRNSAND